MKKILTTFLLILALSSVSYGAVSQDMTVYVRQDVFDAKMETLFERLHGEIVEMKSEIMGEIKTLSGRIDALSGRIDGMDYKIDVLQTVVYRGLGILSLLVGLFVLAPVVGSFMKNIRKPSLSPEEIKQLISTAIAEAQLGTRPQL